MSSLVYQPGHYRGTITRWNLGKASTGNAQFTLSFNVIGEYTEDGELVQCSESERTIYRTITQKTVDYVIRDLRALGFDGDSFSQLDPGATGAFNFRGIDVEVTCKHETYQGKTREKWEFTMGGGQAVPMEADEVKKLDALFGKKLRGDRGPQVAASQVNNGGVEDEIPF